MKVRVSYTVEVQPWWRRAIRQWYGEPGYANREQVRDWLKTHGTSMDDDLAAMYYKDAAA